MAPPANMVPKLMNQLFDWINKEKDNVNPLILSSVFHYEFVFIHPFSDSNGRMARIWQTTILSKWKEIFRYIPIEDLIKKNQQEYYKVINNCNNTGNSNAFIEFMLKMIDETIDKIVIEQNTVQEKILELVRKDPDITQVEMAKKIGITRNGIAYNIKILKEKGIIERIGSTKNGTWKIVK